LPLVVVIPESEAQVAAVLAACHALNVPVVARGAGTGLSGGALPHAMGVSLSLAKFNSIVKVDPVARTAVVQCGVRNLAISEAAAPYGLYYAPDPSSQIACTIGGNVAENSGGVHCLKYGLTLHNVLRVRGFTAEGEAVEFGSEAPDTAGLDLLPLVVGSEGMLAVIMEVTVRLLPRPKLARCIMASFATVESAGAAVAAVIAAGIIPAGLELMDKRMTAAAEDYVHAGYDLDAAAILLCESDGTPAEVDEEIERAIGVLNANGATRIAISRDEQQRLQFWSGRKNAFPASGRMSPDYMCMDSTIPRKRLAEMLRTIGEMEGKYALRCVNVFHAGDGNLHPLILFDANDPDEMRRCELFGAEILETSIKLGGTVTGEHGVGVEKLNSMCVQFSPAERAQMMAVKSAFDPAGLLNPGKVIPSLQRCAEYGKMHVQRGVLKFPDLPRF
jgi:glycolate oxidase